MKIGTYLMLRALSFASCFRFSRCFSALLAKGCLTCHRYDGKGEEEVVSVSVWRLVFDRVALLHSLEDEVEWAVLIQLRSARCG